MGGKEAECVVAPIVGESRSQKVNFRDEMMNWKEFDGGNPECLEMGDHRRMSNTCVGSALVLGDVGVLHGKPANVRLVDDGVLPRCLRQ